MLRQVFDTRLLRDPFGQGQYRLARLVDQVKNFFAAICPIQRRDYLPAFLVVELLTVPIDDFHTCLATLRCNLSQCPEHGRMGLYHAIRLSLESVKPIRG